jgi:spermidine synthase
VPILAFLFVLSGAAGLIYESVWARYIGLLVGHSAYAQVIVLVIFLGGMAIGSLVVGRRSASIASPLRWYAITEAVIGGLGFAFHSVFTGATRIAYERLLPSLSPGVSSTAAMWSIAALLILPQSILLGATFPLMTAGVIRLRPDRSGLALGLFYFANSFGAAAGAIVEGFVLIGTVGLNGTLYVAGALNLVVAGGVAIAMRTSARTESAAPPPASPLFLRADGLERLLLAVSFTTALSSFFYEIAWTRMLSLVHGSATHSFEIMLSAFVLGLAAGSLWISRRADRGDSLTLLGRLQWAMGIAAIATLPLYVLTFNWTASLLTALPETDAAYKTYSLARYGMTLVVMLPATFCAGTTLPLITQSLLGAGSGERAIGYVYGANTIGSILGAGIAALLLVPLIGLKALLIVGGVIDIAVGVVLLLRAQQASAPMMGALAATALGIAFLAFLSPFTPATLASGVYRYAAVPDASVYRYFFYKDGRTASVSVRQVRTDTTGLMTISTNGKPDASVSPNWIREYSDTNPKMLLDEDMSTQIYLPVLTLAHAPKATIGAVIGQGSGVTSHLLLASPTLRRLHTIEIEPEMINGSRVFYPGNARVFDDPRSKFEHDDARAFLATNGPKFDFVLSEPSNPWVSGVSSLFTVEFYRRVKTRLQPSGVLVQWFHLYEMNDATVASVLRSIDSVFPSYRLYMSSNTDIIVVAGAAPKLQAPDWSVLTQPAMAKDLRRFTSLTPETIEAAEVGGREALHGYLSSATINSDFRPYLDLNGERLRFEKEYASGTEDLGETRLDIPAALEGRRRGFGTLELNPTPEIKRSGALVEGKQLHEALGGQRTTPTDDSLRGKVIALRSFLIRTSGAIPASNWTEWVTDFISAEAELHGGSAGVADEAFYGKVRKFVDGSNAPPPAVRAVVDFYHGLAAWDFAEASRAGDALLAERDAQRTWIPIATLRQGTALAKIKLGDTAGAKGVYDRLRPDTMTVADRVLAGIIEQRSAKR